MRTSLTIAGFAALVALPSAGFSQDTTSGVRIGLTYTGAMPGVVVLPVNGANGDSIRAIVQRDLDYSDRIKVIALDSIPSTSSSGPNYALFSRLNAAAMLQITTTPFGVNVAVHDVSKKKVERVKDFPLPSAALGPDWRLGLHNISDEVESWLTGTRGIASTRLLYVSGKRIWQIDSDGANPTVVSAGGDAMSPAWHPRATHVAYTLFTPQGTQIVVREMGGATRALPAPPGSLNATPRFSPDGNTLVYAHARESGTDLYAVNAFGNDPARRVTVGRGSDNISPSFSPDGRRLAFTSNRTGRPEVYISDADGTNAQLLTTTVGEQPYRSDPDWSPDGRLIAYQSQVAGQFQLYTIGLRDRGVRQLTNIGRNEDPSWAPDSRHIVFTSNRSGVPQLWVLDVESARVRQLTTGPAGARLPSWSPYLVLR